MRSINKILLIFLGVTALFVFLSWQFIQSEAFSTFVSNEISKQLEKKFNVHTSFDRLDFQFWPPRTNIHSFKLSHKDRDVEFYAETLSLEFSLLSMLEREFVIDTLRVKNGGVTINKKIRKIFKNEKDKNRNEDKKKITETIKQTQNEYPSYYKLFRKTVEEEIPFKVRGITLENFNIVGKTESFKLSSFKFVDYTKSFKLTGLVEDVKILREISGRLNIPVDSVEFSFQFSRKRVRVLDFIVFSRLSYMKVSGNWGGGDKFELQGQYKGGLDKLLPLVEHKYSTLINRGYSDIRVDVFGTLANPEVEFDVDLVGIESPHVKAEELSFSGGIKDWVVSLKNAGANMGSGHIELKDKFEVFDIQNETILANEINLSLSEVYTNDLLYFLKEDLSVLKANLSGDVELSFSENKLDILVRDKFKISDFHLVNEENGDDILKKKSLRLGPSLIKVGLNSEIIKMDMGILLESSYLPFKGKIGNGNVDFNLKETVVNLEELGSISGVPLSGSGVVDLSIHGSVENVMFDFSLDMEDFRVLGLRLGHIKGPLQFNLNSSLLTTPKIEASKKETNYSLKGDINFEAEHPEENLDLTVDIKKGTYDDIVDLIHPITKDLEFLDDSVEYSFSGKAKVGGNFENEDIRLSSHIEGVDFSYLGEDLDHLEMDINYSEKTLTLNNIQARKGKGEIEGLFRINTETEEIFYKGETAGIFLSDFDFYKVMGFGLDAEIVGDVKGEGAISNFVSDHHFELRRSNVLGKKLPSSELNIVTNGEHLTFSGFLLGDTFSLDSKYYFDPNSEEKSNFNAVLNIKNMKNFLGALSAHNLRNDSLSGNARVDLRSKFRSLEFNELDLELDVHDFSLEKNELNLALEEKDKIQGIRVDNGKIKKWAFSLVGNSDTYFRSQGEGNVAKGMTIRTKASLQARLLETLTNKVRGADGMIDIESIISGQVNRMTHLTHLKGRDIELRAQQLPGLIGNGVFDIVVDNDEVLVQKLNFDYGKGSISASGNMRFAFPYPVFSINWEVENAAVPILSKSQVNVSGSGQLIGEKVPYLLRGNIRILHGNIVESLEDFRKSSGQLETYSRFIPKRQALSETNILEYDITVNTIRPILLKNSLAELYLRGGVRLHGFSYAPLYTGRIEVVPEKSKFKFKGHEFLLSEGSVDLRGSGGSGSPVVNFDGVAEVNQYEIFLEVSGPADSASVVLTSDPPLGKEDIFSLLTLGVTTNVSQELAESERQSITTIGVGTLLFEQFKINEGISSSLGLRLSVSPEVSENEATLLQGKSAISENGSTRVKSATKIKVQKQISEKMDLSVSSTVGGTLEQKQEMNLNYQLSDILSVEGVYEVKSGEEHATDTPDSAGADLKWRLSF